jgi:hypothetical protein
MPATERVLRALLLLCCLLGSAALPAPASAQPSSPAIAGAATAAPRIGLVTMEPGEIFFERFGHDAILVVDPATGRGTSYNFGFFDPGEPGFVGNFVRGVMRYHLVALPIEADLA